MADWEQLLISKVLREGDIKPAIKANITEDYFTDETHRRAWSFIRDHWGEYGGVPTTQTFRANFPRGVYKLVDVDDEPYALIINRIREQRRMTLAMLMATDINKELSGEDPKVDNVLKVIAEAQIDLLSQTGTTDDVNLTITGKERLAYYDDIKTSDGITGIPTGLPSIDTATGGLQPEQLITLIGLPKSQKSVWLLRIAMNVRNAGYVPLFVGFEMSNREQAMRYDAMIAGLDHRKLRTGQLQPSERRRLKEALDDDAAVGTPFILSADRERATTVSGIRAKIEEYKPNVVFIDGAYMMDDELRAPEDWKRLTNITRSLKRMAQQVEIPIFVTTQALASKYNKRLGLQQDVIGYTSSFAQDSDVVLGVENIDDMEDVQLLRVVVARNVPPMAIDVRCDWANGTFEEIGAHDPSVHAAERDDDDEV